MIILNTHLKLRKWCSHYVISHYSDIIMGTMASKITSLMIVYLTIYSGAGRRKHQGSASLDFVWGIDRWLVNSLHKGPVMQKCFHLMTPSCNKHFSETNNRDCTSLNSSAGKGTQHKACVIWMNTQWTWPPLALSRNILLDKCQISLSYSDKS